MDIYIPPLTGKPEQQLFTMQSGVLTGNDTGGAAQVRRPIARMNGLWTPQSAAITDPPMPQPAAVFSGNDSLFLVASVTTYQILIATHLPTPDGPTGMEG